ncbi:hypothetical protein ACFSPU_05155 [Haoranjiania flava]|uniref:Uncharacterized protein n=1 Tax=Haoranjiania flava TaxID=1856322 RepID=A0AAE3IKY2_9BACT|nr:hypothetical protein [Haoranjiania flava]MCU7693714.1 hypothetical protein [Haoranjiania flava]
MENINSLDFEKILSLLSEIKERENKNMIKESVAACAVEAIQNIFKN